MLDLTWVGKSKPSGGSFLDTNNFLEVILKKTNSSNNSLTILSTFYSKPDSTLDSTLINLIQTIDGSSIYEDP